ncbi:uncharacterized protein LOC118451433 [Vespa mandarinia]|uniref:uncharacterized protein LOC118451433 n=1 Tax=Vespa mandarinia TaxID=7446 RepID=UPI0016161D50|nr:uncharacterized protein LOC118451433 [Vespa mandarinia]XP_035743870.1 uncharacterized protein LOC118451433 [Vespa mandarinia]XP_035743871.1 uncharacterized protein LOC118451433 [Vespa mandarinia]
MALPSSRNPNTISWSGGRSRGRVKVAEVPLRRPGENPSSKYNQFVCDDIIERINNLGINELIPAEQINDIVHLVHTTKDEETLKFMFDMLYKRALEDKIFGIKLASLFSDVTFFTIEVNKNQTMRYLLLSTLQNDYKRKKEIREESATLFRNVVSLLGEIYYQMTLITGKPLRILELPLLDYWSMLLETATEEDIELVATQIIINGKGMYKRPELDEFMLNVRETLSRNNTLSYAAKGMLLLIIDLANQQFNSLPVNLYDYYTSHLGTKVLIYLQRHNKDLTNAGNNEDLKIVKSLEENKNDTNQESELGSTSMVQSKQKASFKDENCEQTDYAVMNTDKKNFTTENTVPRAIRGPGANNTKKNFKSNSKPFTNPISPKPGNRNKGWEHDDRFEDAYD